MINIILPFLAKKLDPYPFTRCPFLCMNVPRRRSSARSHSHQNVRESYLIQSGQILFVELDGNGELHGQMYRAGEEFRTIPGRPHNLFVFAGADFLTVKYGGGAKDWIASPELDARTTRLDEATILTQFSR